MLVAILAHMQRAFVSLVALLAYGCVGTIGDGGAGSAGPSDAPPEPGTFACTPGDPSATVLPRLSHAQYLNSLAALAGQDAGPIMASLPDSLALVPPDSSFDHARLDQSVSQAHIDGQYHVAVAFAAQMVTPERLGNLLGSCGTDADPSNDDACIEEFIRSFGYRAHKKPLADAEVDFYRLDVYEPADGIDPEGVADVIAVMALSPQFLYRVEQDGAEIAGDLFELSAHELAARLSFHLWDAPPDDALYAAADSGELMSDEGYEAQVDRMLDDPRTLTTIDRYFSEWLWLDDLAPQDTEQLRQAMLDETLAFARYTTWQSDGTLADLFTSNLSFASDPQLADIYGVPVWQEGASPPEAPGRAGILTRAAMLATGSESTHPILRGREVRRRVLCHDIPAPPDDATDNLPELDPMMTTRARVEAQTEQPGSSCLNCHASINPLGFAFEGYDGLGRARSTETIYDDGAVIGTLPVDTTVSPQIDGDDDAVVQDGVELSAHLAESTHTHACFARHYFRFTFGRLENDDIDGCALENMRTSSLDGASLKDLFRSIAMSPTFRQRKLASD